MPLDADVHLVLCSFGRAGLAYVEADPAESDTSTTLNSVGTGIRCGGRNERGRGLVSGRVGCDGRARSRSARGHAAYGGTLASLMLTSQRRRCCRCGAPAGSAASSRCPAGISRVPTGWRGSSQSGWDRATGLAVRRTSSNSKIRRLGAETGSGRGLGELILDRSLAGSLFANRFLGEFSRLNLSRASMCALCRPKRLTLARWGAARPTAGNHTNDFCTSRG